MKMAKVVFLELDGVVFNMRSDFLPANQRYRDGDPVAVPVASECDPLSVVMIQRLIEVSQARVVAATAAAAETTLGPSWIERILQQAGWSVRPHWHEDWRLADPRPRNRPWAIGEWLDQHPEVTRWVALSSDPAPSPGWIEIDPELGMGVPDYRRALMLLDSSDRRFSGPASGWPQWTEAGSRNAVRRWLNHAFAPVPSSAMSDRNRELDPVMQALNADDPWKHPHGPSSFVTDRKKSCS